MPIFWGLFFCASSFWDVHLLCLFFLFSFLFDFLAARVGRIGVGEVGGTPSSASSGSEIEHVCRSASLPDADDAELRRVGHLGTGGGPKGCKPSQARRRRHCTRRMPTFNIYIQAHCCTLRCTAHTARVPFAGALSRQHAQEFLRTVCDPPANNQFVEAYR